ncbi:hypothetical protein [Jannaschia formosa]|uniref:hypothetical protein n=1 Tax=Jannaschia formosa TaxID=2259592 RepID=UPI00107577C4|nr:hypothetical protein [Jannaschia formosa]TFL16961.1 hypothetical protein DR046_16960 [Jannaschia formosa]
MASSLIIDFEGVALENVSNLSPLNVDGFTFSTTDAESAVFGAGSGVLFPPQETTFLAFAESNTITLTSGGIFDLVSLIAGPTSLAAGSTVDFTVSSTFANSTTSFQTFEELGEATLLSLNLTGLTSVAFTTTDDAAIDELVIGAIPTPGPAILLGSALLGAFGLRRLARRAS